MIYCGLVFTADFAQPPVRLTNYWETNSTVREEEST